MKRTIICEVEVDDDVAQKEIDDGPVAYLEKEFGWLEQSGITLVDAMLLDEDSDSPHERIVLKTIRELLAQAHEEQDLTNREWLESLSDDELAAFLTSDLIVNYDPWARWESISKVSLRFTQSQTGVKDWLSKPCEFLTDKKEEGEHGT